VDGWSGAFHTHSSHPIPLAPVCSLPLGLSAARLPRSPHTSRRSLCTSDRRFLAATLPARTRGTPLCHRRGARPRNGAGPRSRARGLGGRHVPHVDRGAAPTFLPACSQAARIDIRRGASCACQQWLPAAVITEGQTDRTPMSPRASRHSLMISDHGG
jgi:hypothetical protein